MKTFDELIASLNGYGKYQQRVFGLLCVPAMCVGIQKFVGVFTQAIPPHRCRLPFELENATYPLDKATMEKYYPIDKATKELSICTYLDPEKTEHHCNSWIYDKSIFDSSTVMEWDLVCDKAWYKSISDSAFMIGEMIGSSVFGWLSDRIGRRKALLSGLILIFMVGLATSFSASIYYFIVLRCFLGAVNVGSFLVDYVLALEIVGPSHRTAVGIVLQLLFTVGALMACFGAFFVREWRALQITMSAPAAMFILYYLWIPESIRWLLSKGEYDNVRESIRKVAEVNKRTLDEEKLNQVIAEAEEERLRQKEKKPSIFHVCRYPTLTRRLFVVFYIWYVIPFVFGTLVIFSARGNPFIIYSMTVGVEIPAYIFLMLTLKTLGRKTVMCGAMLTAGCCLIGCSFIPQDLYWLKLGTALFAKVAITSGYGTVYIYAVELFPTSVRNAVLGTISTFARLGGVIAPYVIYLARYWAPIPLLVMGLLLFLGGLATLILPETLNQSLPDTLQEGAALGKDDGGKEGRSQDNIVTQKERDHGKIKIHEGTEEFQEKERGGKKNENQESPGAIRPEDNETKENTSP